MLFGVFTAPIVAKVSFTFDVWPCANQDCDKETFHGYVGQVYMKYIFMGLLNGSIWFLLDRSRYKKGKSMKIHNKEEYEYNKSLGRLVYLYVIPGALLDFGATIFERKATYYAKASTCSLIGVVSIFVSAIGRTLLEKQGFLICEYMGLIILSLCTVSLNVLDALRDTRDSEYSDDPSLGIILATVGAVLRGSQFVWHNYVRRYKFPQCKYSFMETAVNLVACLVLSMVLQLTHYEDLVTDFWSTVSNWKVLLLTIVFGAISAVFQVSNVILSRYLTGALRMFLVRTSSVGTWIFESIFGLGSWSGWEFGSYISLFIGLMLFSGLIATEDRFSWMLYYPQCCSLKAPPFAVARKSSTDPPDSNMSISEPIAFDKNMVYSYSQRYI